jgi:hypothetical protein
MFWGHSWEKWPKSKVCFGRWFFGRFLVVRNCAQDKKIRPNGKISSNLVTLMFSDHFFQGLSSARRSRKTFRIAILRLRDFATSRFCDFAILRLRDFATSLFEACDKICFHRPTRSSQLRAADAEMICEKKKVSTRPNFPRKVCERQLGNLT